jgi:ribonuclease HII
LRGAAALLYAARVRVDELRGTPVPELQRLYVDECRELPSGGLTALKADPRAGARAIAEKIDRRNHKAQAEGRRLSRLCAFELPLWEQGITLVGGCDEVGMAPLAGPVIAAAVILRPGSRIIGVNDSKQLTPEEREELEPEIRAQAVAVGIGRAEVIEIDTINIYRAGLIALKRAVLALNPQPQHLLVDARKLDGLGMPQQPIIKGDAKSITIGAASIVAKVHRDRLMAELDGDYPGYGFADHKGYPTPEHLDALERLGACPLHRRSFAPVAKKLGLIPEQQDLFATPKKRAGEAR